MSRPNANHAFAQVPVATIPRSSFNRTSTNKTTFNAGWLVPFFVDEALPGDTFNAKAHFFARLATPLKPFMDNMYLDVFYFSVANRLVWNNWKKFNGEQTNPGDSTDFLIPQMVSPSGGYVAPANWLAPTTAELAGALSDYFTLPMAGTGGVAPGNTITHSSLWHRAYNLIYNEWFRDQNLQTSATVDLGDGPDTYTNYPLRRRGKRHDYFTSALPWPQKGSAVNLPLGTSAPVRGIGITDGTGSLSTDRTVRETPASITGAQPSTIVYDNNWQGSSGGLYFNATGNGPADANIHLAIYADLTAATAVTVNAMRQSFQIQKLYERDARGGTRYTEVIKSHFGVTSPDARQQRPEYLGGGSVPLNINPVAQTSAGNTQPTPQGNLAGMGTVQGHDLGFTKSFTEHSLIIGLVSVRAELTYQQGMNKMFSRRTRFEFYWPALSHIGEQAVLNREIYCDGSANDALVFGYQERFAEYRYKPSTITGKFRSTDATPLDMWHLAQEFASLPALNSTFIQENPPVDRVVAVTTEPHFLMDSWIELHCARPMPIFSVPGLIDHF